MNNDVRLAKWLNDELEGQELKEFESLPEFATYSKIKKYSAELLAPAADMDALYAKINEQKYNRNINNTPKVRRLNAWVPRIAAVLILALGISFYLFASHITTQHAGNAEMAAFMLPDNSEVVLNAGSEAEYKEFNWSSNRRLELDGEAYFKAAKGTTFDVVTPLGTVTVVGTQFNVKARNGRFDVTCYEGKVRVATANDTVMLTPGKTVAFENNSNLHLPDTKRTEPGWVRHEAVFANEQSTAVMAELERQFGTTITFEGDAPQKRYNGTVPTKNLNTALDIVRTTYGLNYKKQGDKIVLYSE